MRGRFEKEIVDHGARICAAKLAERDQRVQRRRPRYIVEPNVKEGKGRPGDPNTLFWIGEIRLSRTPGEGSRHRRPVHASELKLPERCDEFLGACAAICISCRGSRRGTPEPTSSARAAGAIGLPHAGLGVERFMKHYFLVAKDVGDLTAMYRLRGALKSRQAKPRPVLDRFGGLAPAQAIDSGRFFGRIRSRHGSRPTCSTAIPSI